MSYDELDSGFVLAPVAQAEQNVADALDELLRASAAVAELGGADRVADRLLPLPGVIEGLMRRIDGTEDGPRSFKRRKLAELVAASVVAQLREDPSLVSRMDEFGQVGLSVASALALSASSEPTTEQLLRQVRGEPEPPLMLMRDGRKTLERLRLQSDELESAAAVHALRADLGELVAAFNALAAREQPAPQVTVEPGEPLDLSPLVDGVVSAIAETLAPLLQVLGEVVRDLAKAPPAKRLTVRRKKGTGRDHRPSD